MLFCSLAGVTLGGVSETLGFAYSALSELY